MATFQVLVYPIVNFNGHYKSMEEFENGPVIPRKTLDW